ncbi:MAG TPA: hypothetical protein PLA68_01225 [Panacibacter sp.]|nr:hypothetical protein [Panacibacter sp.]
MEQPTTAFPEWNFSKKTAFRFFFIFFILYVFFNPNGFFPYYDYVYEFYITPFRQLVPWAGKNILGLAEEATDHPTGSGDTLFAYVTLFLIAATSFTGCIIWTIADRRRKSYNTLYYWLTVVVRYYLALTMLSYGFYKVYKLQFPFPGPGILSEPYGASSPMRLAWTFMGFSKGYNYFTGFGEVFSGLFLLFRRSATMGALLSLVVAGNVMAINYFFDVPVKLLSTMLVVMSLFLLAKDAKRLLNFLVLNKTAEPSNIAIPEFKKKWMNICLVVLKYAVLLFVFYSNISGGIDGLKEYGDDAPKAPLYGIYNVETFIKNNDTLPPLKTDTLRWNKLIVSWQGYAGVKMMNDSSQSYAFEPDTIAKKIVMYNYDDTARKSLFTYSIPEKDVMILSGKWNQDSVTISMKKYDLNNFLLVSRGFHWVNEYPYNR